MDNPVRIKMENDDDYAGAGAVHMFGAHAAAISSQYKVNSVKNEPCEAAGAAAAASGETSRHYPPLSTAMTSGVRDVAAPISCEAMRPNVNNNGGAHSLNKPVGIKTPKYSGRSDWEAFHAQFELLAHAYAWSEEQKALQLALCLTDDALSCLLLLDISERADYGALVGALRRRFGQCFRSELLRSELHSRQRIPGEPLRALANDIESLARRAYAHIPPSVQSELARDQFIRALSPAELRIHTQLARPHDLAEALELALER
ncbi:contactin-associated -like 5 [Labeo rohita]|uniref:Contactin-associated-like 5 n=1 Tax=Labeo rohita TaxID=84645 RepID=A0A498NUP4_LABRO|nr:contactin-associated -like 5 [Labeo rohita]